MKNKRRFGLVIEGKGKIDAEKMHNYVKKILENEKIPFLEFNYDYIFNRDRVLGDENDRDELFEEARMLAICYGEISGSFLQSRLRIGFMRTARIIDQLKRAGIVSEKKSNGMYDVVDTVSPEDLEKFEKERVQASRRYLSENSSEDQLYEEAKMLVISSQQASASFLQIKLRIGYQRASRIMDRLIEDGIISERRGACPCEVYYEIDSKGKVRKKKKGK